MTDHRPLVFSGLLCSLLLLPVPSNAAEDGESAPAADDIVEMETVVVTSSAMPEAPLTPQTDRVISVPGAGNDPLRALESLPGVVFGPGRQAAPAIRGSSPQENTYYLDFLPVGYLFHVDGSSILSDELTQNFTLYNAAFPSRYNKATGGVIDSESISADQLENNAVIDLSLLRAGVLVGGDISNDQAFYLSGRMSLFQYYLENLVDDDDFEFTTVPEFYDYQGQWQKRFSNGAELSLQLTGARDKAGLLFDEDSDQVQQDPALAGGIDAEQYYNQQGLLLENDDGNRSYRAGLYHLEETFGYRIGTGNTINANSHTYGIRSRFDRETTLLARGIFTWGFDISEQRIDYAGSFSAPPCDEFRSDCRLSDATETVSGDGVVVLRDYNLFINRALQLAEGWQFSFGPLVSYNDYTGNAFLEPRINNRLNLSDRLVWTAAYGRHHVITGNPGQYVEEFGNPDLDETRAIHYATGFEYELQDGLMLTSEVYYKKLFDIVVARPAEENYPGLSESQYNDLPRYSNSAEGRAYGLETLLYATFSQRWYGWASLALSHSERENRLTGENFTYEYDKPVVINLVGSYQWNEHWRLGLRWRYQSGQLITPLEGAVPDADVPGLYNPVYGSPFSERLPDYHKLDFRADRRFNLSRSELDLYLEILNLYNRENVVGYTYENADYSGKEEVNDLPLMLSLGVKARF